MSDEIAVIGLAGRFPGAPDVATLWRNVRDGVDAIHDYTDDELRAIGIGVGLLADPAHIRAHGRLAGVADFDAGFFAMSDAEAASLDPQHRLFLEQSWVALEDAGCDPAGFPGPIGVYSGCSANRYFLFHQLGNPAVDRADPDDWEARLAGGVTPDHLPTQVAYRLGLTGPAVAVQAACASSLVAVCLAAQSLADYRCDLALAGGVAVTAPRYRYAAGGLFSPDGRCRAFDAAAQGSGLSSGVAVLALKRLDDARADRDQIYAVLRGWAVTNDGARRVGYTAPGVAGQSAAVAEALASAELPAESIGLVEAHGSGTPVGDAIEVAALTAAFDTPTRGFCALGSVKTNVGNLDAAGGATGLVKAVYAVRDGIIPAHPHFDQAHPEIEMDRSPFWVPTKTQPWPATPGPRRAGVNSFGQGGTNAHVIVEQPPPDNRPPLDNRAPAEEEEWAPARERVPQSAGGYSPGPYVVPVSAGSPRGLATAIRALHGHLAAAPNGPRLDDVAYTLGLRRRGYPCRAAVICADLAGAVVALARLIELGVDVAGGIETTYPDGMAAELAAMTAAWVRGVDVDWATVLPIADARVVSLPGYPFQRSRHWIDPPQRGGL